MRVQDTYKTRIRYMEQWQKYCRSNTVTDYGTDYSLYHEITTVVSHVVRAGLKARY